MSISISKRLICFSSTSSETGLEKRETEIGKRVDSLQPKAITERFQRNNSKEFKDELSEGRSMSRKDNLI